MGGGSIREEIFGFLLGWSFFGCGVGGIVLWFGRGNYRLYYY